MRLDGVFHFLARQLNCELLRLHERLWVRRARNLCPGSSSQPGWLDRFDDEAVVTGKENVDG